MKNFNNMTEKSNICKVNYHFTFPWLITYRCGNCYNFLGDNLDYSKNQEYKCPKCGYINIDNDTGIISIDEYPKIIKAIENEIEDIKRGKQNG